jgi:hypothetical protein
MAVNAVLYVAVKLETVTVVVTVAFTVSLNAPVAVEDDESVTVMI